MLPPEHAVSAATANIDRPCAILRFTEPSQPVTRRHRPSFPRRAGRFRMSGASPPIPWRIPTPFGRDLLIIGNGAAIVSSDFVAPSRQRARKPSDALLAEAWTQVEAYFARRLLRFELPLALSGTAFQIDVWCAVASLRFGEFVSYADVARAVGKPLAHRGVAAAMSQTTIDLFVPAHRVVGADGQIKGAAPRSMRTRLARFELAGSPAKRRTPHFRGSLPRIAFDRR